MLKLYNNEEEIFTASLESFGHCDSHSGYYLSIDKQGNCSLSESCPTQLYTIHYSTLFVQYLWEYIKESLQKKTLINPLCFSITSDHTNVIHEEPKYNFDLYIQQNDTAEKGPLVHSRFNKAPAIYYFSIVNRAKDFRDSLQDTFSGKSEVVCTTCQSTDKACSMFDPFIMLGIAYLLLHQKIAKVIRILSEYERKNTI